MDDGPDEYELRLIHRSAHNQALNRELRACLERLAASQQPLGEPFETILYENLWDLYAR